MKRIIFIAVSLVLVTLCILSTASEKRLISDSEKTVEKYGGVYINSDNAIISLYSYHGKAAFLDNLWAVTVLGDKAEIPVYLAIPPRKMDITPLPEDINTPHKKLFELAESECKKHDVTYIDLLPSLSQGKLYFNTDHHWTSDGAYIAYCEIIKVLGETPHDKSDFEIKTANTSYRGSDYNKIKDKYSYNTYDTIELYCTPTMDSLTATVVAYPYDSEENNRILPHMYSTKALESWDPYTVYFEGNQPYVTVRSSTQRETLLLVRDSFASALAPLLALHFDIVMIDPRFYPEPLSTAVKREGVSKILVLENMGSFTENTIKFSY